MSKNRLGEAVAFPSTAMYEALTAQQKTQYVRDDAYAHGYAWGRLDEGFPAIASLDVREEPTRAATAWAFGALYAQMNLELNDVAHHRQFGFSIQEAWAEFAQTGCPGGHLPMHLS